MNRIFLFAAILAISGVVISCKKDYKTRVCESASNINELCDEDSSRVNVRIYNDTGFPLCDLKVKLNSNEPDFIKLGRVEPGELSCYVVYDQIQVYPQVRFQLGVRDFAIADTLIENMEYSGLLFNRPGFYNLEIQIAGTLDAGYADTFLSRVNL